MVGTAVAGDGLPWDITDGARTDWEQRKHLDLRALTVTKQRWRAVGKFKEPVWLSIDATDPVVQACFPHLWSTHPRGDLCEAVMYPSSPVTICAHCFVEECVQLRDGHRCLLPLGHTGQVLHVNVDNLRWG